MVQVSERGRSIWNHRTHSPLPTQPPTQNSSGFAYVLNYLHYHLNSCLGLIGLFSGWGQWKIVVQKQGVLKIYVKFITEHPRRSAISIKLLCNFIEITLRRECSLINLLYIFRTLLPKNTSGHLLLVVQRWFTTKVILTHISENSKP